LTSYVQRFVMQELLTKEVLNLDDLDRIMGKRPFQTKELRNVDKFRGLTQWLPSSDGIWSWIESFRSPGLPLAFDGPALDDGPTFVSPADDDDEDNSSGGGGSGGGGGGGQPQEGGGISGWWSDEAENSAKKVQDLKKKFPTAT
jgi:hypothetical protein